MNPDPLIIAIASGKGGVGKTMLSVACAYELSLGGPTLLLDLDFFNRGLAGLFPQGEIIGEVARPDFLAAPDSGEKEPWRLIRIAHDLFHVTFPDLGPAELSGLEVSKVGDIRESLGRFIEAVREKCGALRVVLDCHGGPDHTSFAAAMLARHTLLISEPDRITFHGTLNFLRQLDRSLAPPPPRMGAVMDASAALASGQVALKIGPPLSAERFEQEIIALRSLAHPTGPPAPPHGPPIADVRLVFNKIVPAFRAPFLRRLYDENLREEFGGFDLLGMFPMELPLTKAFEETPLLTRAYPYSLLARKMRVLLLDLLEDRARDYLAPSAPTLPGWVRKYRRRTLGRVPWWLDKEVIMQVITLTTFFFIVVSFLDQRVVQPSLHSITDATARLTLIGILNKFPDLEPAKGSAEREFLEGGNSKIDPNQLAAELNRLTRDPITGQWDFGQPYALLYGFTERIRNGPEENLDSSQSIQEEVAPMLLLVSLKRPHAIFSDLWARNAALLKSLMSPSGKWLLHDLRVWWNVWYLHGVTLAITWLAVAFHLEFTRRLDALFTRKLRTSFYWGVAILGAAIIIWVVPPFLISAGMKLETEHQVPDPVMLAAGLLVAAYLLLLGSEGYRCWRLVYEGMRDLAGSGEKGRLQADRFRILGGRLLAVTAEVYLRAIFVFTLAAMLFLLYLIVVRHESIE